MSDLKANIEAAVNEARATSTATIAKYEDFVAAARCAVSAIEDEMAERLEEARQEERDAVEALKAACKAAGIPCAESAGRSAPVSARIGFEVSVASGPEGSRRIKVAVKGRPETEEVFALPLSPNKVANDYCAKHVGYKSVVGNKAGTLGNRIRAVLRA